MAIPVGLLLYFYYYEANGAKIMPCESLPGQPELPDPGQQIPPKKLSDSTHSEAYGMAA